MSLDVATLFAVTVFATGLGGLLLLFAWLQSRGTLALAWWGSAFIVLTPAIALFGLRGPAAETWSTQVAASLIMLAYGLLWTGARVFEDRKALPLWAAAGALVWLTACQLQPFCNRRPRASCSPPAS